MSRSFESLNAMEVLALAISVERANASRLRAFAGIFRGYDADVAEKFLELASEEEDHEAMLVKRFRKRYGESIPEIQEVDVEGVIESADVDDGEQMIFDTLNCVEVCRQVLAAERGARNYYHKALIRTSDPELKDLYRELAEMEDQHAGWIERKLAALSEGKGAGYSGASGEREHAAGRLKRFRANGPTTEMSDDVDYLFCPVCRVHIPCRRLESGGWEVCCPGCHGECAYCSCYLQRFCFGSRDQFPPFP